MKGPGKMFGGKVSQLRVSINPLLSQQFGGFKKQQNVDDLISEEIGTDPSNKF